MNGAQFQRAITLAFAPSRAWPEIARETAAFARRDRDTRIAAEQFPPRFETFVNGQRDAAEETIRPGGVIFYRGLLLGPAIAFALAEWQRRAPVRSGRYRDTLAVGISRGGVEGTAIAADRFRADAVMADATEAFLFSPQPYGRRVDVQLDGTRPIRFSVPEGIVSDVAEAVRRRFPGVNALRLYTVRWPGAQRRKRADGAGTMIHYPGVQISVGR